MKLLTAATLLVTSSILAPSDATHQLRSAIHTNDDLPSALQTEELLSMMSMSTRPTVDPDLLDIVDSLEREGLDVDLAMAMAAMETTGEDVYAKTFTSKCLLLLHLLGKSEYASICDKGMCPTPIPVCKNFPSFTGTWSGGFNTPGIKPHTRFPLEVVFNNDCRTVGLPVGTFLYKEPDEISKLACEGNWDLFEVVSPSVIKVKRVINQAKNPRGCGDGCITTLIFDCAGNKIDGMESFADGSNCNSDLGYTIDLIPGSLPH